MAKNKCKKCGKPCDSDFCFHHKPRGRIKKKPYVPSEGTKGVNELHVFFIKVWNKRRHVSEVSGDRLGSTPLSIFFHHILPKSKFPLAAFDEENIILLTFDEHSSVELDMYKYELINERREYLLKKYNLI